MSEKARINPVEDLFAAGDVEGAIKVAADAVRSKPTDSQARSHLIEMLCFAGKWERADAQLDAAATLEPKAQASISLLRQLVRADMARHQFHEEGRAPEFLTPPPESVKLRLAASIELRAKNFDAAAGLLTQAQTLGTPIAGEENGEKFDELRDLDDLLADVLEVLTPTGKYFWVPLASIETVEFSEPASRLDLLWRQAHMTIRDGGPDGVVYVPCLYSGASLESNPPLRTGRATDWRELPTGSEPIVRGVGLRMFLVGTETRDVLSLKSITFAATSAT